MLRPKSGPVSSFEEAKAKLARPKNVTINSVSAGTWSDFKLMAMRYNLLLPDLFELLVKEGLRSEKAQRYADYDPLA